ncbi:pseudouridine synthase, partial [Gloeopeniophorella convolvens]
PNYDSWTREQLIARLTELAHPPTTHTPAASPPSPTPTAKPKREFTLSAYPTQKIALKFSYAGAGYGGLAWQAGPTPLPTVEAVLFAALAKARLVDAAGGLDGCGWERCGRTDRGVSAAGQVVSLYARSSNAPRAAADGPAAAPVRPIRYLHTLNAVLPPSIRVHAWAPVAPGFSARFACRARHYKYFFSARGLDVAAMRAGAAHLVGEHDFRNLCKLDPAKQLTSFRRRIARADIAPMESGSGGGGDMHVLDLIGSAFLYNQVRHIMAVLFLIGARLEDPSVVPALLNVDANAPRGDGTPLVPRKPEYQMADALPLVLWDCAYASEDAAWRTDDDDGDGRGAAGLHAQMAGLVERAQVEATLAEHFLAAAARYHAPAPVRLRAPGKGERGPWDLPLGGGTARREGTYVPLLERKRLESVEVVNARWLVRKGK